MVHEYEVILKLTNDNTGERSLVTRTEHAYSVMDAAMQATLNAATTAGSAHIDLVSIGPPARLVKAMQERMEAALDELLKKMRKEKA